MMEHSVVKPFVIIEDYEHSDESQHDHDEKKSTVKKSSKASTQSPMKERIFNMFNEGQQQSGKLRIYAAEVKGLVVPSPIKAVYLIVQLDSHQVKSRSVKLEKPSDKNKCTWAEEFLFDLTRDKGEIQASVWGITHSADLAPPAAAAGVGSYGPMLNSSPTAVESHYLDSASCTISKSSIPDKLELRVAGGVLHLMLMYTRTETKVGLDHFELLRVVGKGNFGKVMLVRKKDTGRLYAMKILRKDKIIAADSIAHTINERDVLMKVHHPFIVSLKYSFQTKDKLYMVLDYINGGELFFHLSRVERFPEDRARFYAAEILLAIGYLHSLSIIYRDLKPENLLLDMNGHICVTDFGLVKQGVGYGESTNTFCGSPEYLAPEMLLGQPYGRAVDWWALGTFLYEMIVGLPPFFDDNHKEMNRRILQEPLQFDTTIFSSCAIDLLTGLLQRDPNKRLGSAPADYEEIKNHKWFASIDWKLLHEKKIQPPFKPHIRHALDVQNFETEFTNEPPKDSYVPDSSIPGTAYDSVFANFSYVAPDLLQIRRKTSARKVSIVHSSNTTAHQTPTVSPSPSPSPDLASAAYCDEHELGMFDF